MHLSSSHTSGVRVKSALLQSAHACTRRHTPTVHRLCRTLRKRACEASSPCQQDEKQGDGSWGTRLLRATSGISSRGQMREIQHHIKSQNTEVSFWRRGGIEFTAFCFCAPRVLSFMWIFVSLMCFIVFFLYLPQCKSLRKLLDAV